MSLQEKVASPTKALLDRPCRQNTASNKALPFLLFTKHTVHCAVNLQKQLHSDVYHEHIRSCCISMLAALKSSINSSIYQAESKHEEHEERID